MRSRERDDAGCSLKATSSHIRRGPQMKAKSKRMSSSTLLIVFVDMPSVMKGMILPFSSTGNQSSRGHRGQTAIALGLTALMGVGQTIPMDDLAGGKTGGYIEVDIRISGFPKKQETFVRIHSPRVTVKESLMELV